MSGGNQATVSGSHLPAGRPQFQDSSATHGFSEVLEVLDDLRQDIARLIYSQERATESLEEIRTQVRFTSPGSVSMQHVRSKLALAKAYSHGHDDLPTRTVGAPRGMTPSVVQESAELVAIQSGSSSQRWNTEGSQERQRLSRMPASWATQIKLRAGLDESLNLITREEAQDKLAETRRATERAIGGGNPAKTSLRRPSFRHSLGASNSLGHMRSGRRHTRRLFRIYDPNAKVVAIFDILSLVAFANDLLVTPYSLAWEMRDTNPIIMTTNAASVLYWTFAILVRCRTGFFAGGELKMGQSEILHHYLKTTLVPDVVLVLVDWITLSLSWTPGDHTRHLRFTKLLRITKMLRLAHLWRLMEKIFQSTSFFDDVTKHKLAVLLLQVVGSTILFVHIMACAWYSIGRHGEADTGERWLTGFGTDPLSCVDEACDEIAPVKYLSFFRYTTSFHFTLAQITLGSMEINPANSCERLFGILLLLVGMIFNATIVSLISSQTMAFVQMRRETTALLDTLSRFLDQHKVDLKLQVRVRRQVLERLSSKRRRLTEEDVSAISMLSEDLRKQLLIRTREQYLFTHALFGCWAQTDILAFHELCDAEKGPLHFLSYKSQDFLFLVGDFATGAWLTIHGQLRYFAEVGASRQPEHVPESTWMCEVGLWCQWHHVGNLESTGESQLLHVEARKLLAILTDHGLIGYLTRTYARAFHGCVTTSGPPYSELPTDLRVPHAEPSELLGCDIGLELLRRERLKKDSKLADVPVTALDELEEELREGRCSILLRPGGDLERVVTLLVVEITSSKDDGKVFAEVGQLNSKTGAIKADCVLPAKKRRLGERPEETLDKILAEGLADMKEHLTLQQSRSEVEIKDSPSFGIRTRYIRTVLIFQLSSDFSMHDVPIATNRKKLPITGAASVRRASRSLSGASTPHEARRLSLGVTTTKITLDEVRQQDVYIFKARQPDKYTMCAWVDLRAIRHFKSRRGGRDLEQWMQELIIPYAELVEPEEDPSENSSEGSASSAEASNASDDTQDKVDEI